MKSFYFLLLSLCVASIHAQKSSSSPYYGFHIGIHQSMLTVPENLSRAYAPYQNLGLDFGLEAQIELSNHWRIVPLMQLSFIDAGMDRINSTGENPTYPLYQMALQPKAHVSYFFADEGQGWYLTGGPGFRFAFLPGKVHTNQFSTGSSLLLDVGFGWEGVHSTFRFAPEIRYSYGVQSISQNPLFSHPIRLHTLSFNFHLCG